jgi:hypothetical protein
MAAWAGTVGIAFLDLTGALTETANTGEAVYFLDDEHWGGVGNDRVAEWIATAIGEKRLFEAPRSGER